MADAEVETALRHWGPRLIQNGVDYNDIVWPRSPGSTPGAQWLPWSGTALADEQAGFARGGGRGRARA